jgi:uncharacterized protein YjiS (DUF1127 family)
MSCSGTTCTTSYEIAAAKPFGGFEWLWQRPSVWLAKFNRGCEQSHQHRQLLELSDRLLADIGLSREQAVEEACKSIWIDLTMCRTQR